MRKTLVFRLLLVLLMVSGSSLAWAETSLVYKACPSHLGVSEKDTICVFNEEGRMVDTLYRQNYLNAQLTLFREEIGRLKGNDAKLDQKMGAISTTLEKKITKVQETAVTGLDAAKAQTDKLDVALKTIDSGFASYKESAEKTNANFTSQMAQLMKMIVWVFILSGIGVLGVIVNAFITYRLSRTVTTRIASEVAKENGDIKPPTPGSTKSSGKDDSKANSRETLSLKDSPTMVVSSMSVSPHETQSFQPVYPAEELPEVPLEEVVVPSRSPEEMARLEQMDKSLADLAPSWMHRPGMEVEELEPVIITTPANRGIVERFSSWFGRDTSRTIREPRAAVGR